jgi:hypothetical protein
MDVSGMNYLQHTLGERRGLLQRRRRGQCYILHVKHLLGLGVSNPHRLDPVLIRHHESNQADWLGKSDGEGK